MGARRRPLVLIAAALFVQGAAPALAVRSLPVIVLDAGHGGEDTGVSGERPPAEKNLMLHLANELRQALEKQLPATVRLTRTADQTLSLESRQIIANSHNPDLFISLHGIDPENDEMCVFYFPVIPAEENLKQRMPKPGTLAFRPALWERGQAAFRNASRKKAELMAETWYDPKVGAGKKKHTYLVGTRLALLSGVRSPAVMIEIPLRFKGTPLDNPNRRRRVVQALAAGAVKALQGR